MAASLLDAMRSGLPINLVDYRVPEGETGLVLVDIVNGFCTVGAGNLAPKAPDRQISEMVTVAERLTRRFVERRWPVLAFLDTHEPGKPEPPYPPHCIRGTGEENLVPELAWLADEPDAKLIRTGCINGFVAAIEPIHDGRHGVSHNRVTDWVNGHRLRSIVVAGICTDICVLDFVVTMLSARNVDLMPTLKDVVVLEPATATYDLPGELVAELGLPETAAHPQAAAHHMGLYVMASRGAVLARELTGV
jgi:nicotinamidase-related amidase